MKGFRAGRTVESRRDRLEAVDLQTFITKWRASGASERANKDSFLRDLCDVLGVPHPDAKTGDPERDRYVFEREAVLLHGGERHTVGFIDLYKHGYFVLEAKQGSDAESKKTGTARRGTPAWHVAMQEAFGQARMYTDTIELPPPFVIVTDIGYCFDLYASFDGTRSYRKFPDALSSRISIENLAREPEHLDTLRAIFTDPHSLDPAKRSVTVTREIAGYLANVARSLNEAGHDRVKVAQFLMRCLFTMFVEDIGLLQQPVFTSALKERWLEHSDMFPGEVESLWQKMNEGGFLFGVGNIWRFNGGLFADPTALPLTKQQLGVLALAAQSDWAHVEPAIFGTLLERALDPKERHRLGAHYTPRAYVERLVRPTIEEPLRAEWDNVRAQVLTLAATEDRKSLAEARKIVYAFYDRLTHIRVLDPACGSGNFLFVALDLFKRIENEIIDVLENLGGDRTIVTFGRMVTPEQFLGIEIKEWAKEITELVLWIGWLQWQIRTRGYKNHPEEPILRDYHNIERRDAVLAYDDKVPLLGDDGEVVTRWNGETMKVHPVTGEEVPDESARVPMYQYLNPRQAEWPEAEFVVGNPPFIGNWRMRSALGDGYTETLRRTYNDVPESVDYVMYWWDKAAELTRTGKLRRFGLITTNSFSQAYARRVAQRHIEADPPLSIVFAIPDHPWVDSTAGAAVRIAMSAGTAGRSVGELAHVTREQASETDHVDVAMATRSGFINPNLTIGIDVTTAIPLAANSALCSPGVKLHGSGFLVTREEARTLGFGSDERTRAVIRDYRNGKDLYQVARDLLVVDLFGRTIEDVRREFPAVYQHMVNHVKPERDQNTRPSYRNNWWIFGEPRANLRPALTGLPRYIATVETAKHRVFVFLDAQIVPDNKLIVVALDDAYVLGILSSRVHVAWTLAAGARLEDRPVYVKSDCFDPFPFPHPPEPLCDRIRELGEQLDTHRKRQQELNPDLTITGMYNVLEKLRSGDILTAKEKKIHEQGLVSVLKETHDELDAAVFDSYGWPHDLSDEEIFERLVTLNAERAEEERQGIVRWLRPEFQNPAGAAAPTQVAIGIEVEAATRGTATPKKRELPPWPKKLGDQVAAVRDLVATNGRSQKTWSAEDVARAFKGSRRTDVAAVLDALGALGIVAAFGTGQDRRWKATEA